MGPFLVSNDFALCNVGIIEIVTGMVVVFNCSSVTLNISTPKWCNLLDKHTHFYAQLSDAGLGFGGSDLPFIQRLHL